MKPMHVVTAKGNIAENVIMPGDPLRAKYIAEKFLENPVLINSVTFSNIKKILLKK